jgi:hypothetical protein
MKNDPSSLPPQRDPIAEKMRDTATLQKIVKQAVSEAVDKAQRLGFLPDRSPAKNGE